MTGKKFELLMKRIKGEVTDGTEHDFFSNEINVLDGEFNTLTRIQLLQVIRELNKQMIASTENWEGG